MRLQRHVPLLISHCLVIVSRRGAVNGSARYLAAQRSLCYDLIVNFIVDLDVGTRVNSVERVWTRVPRLHHFAVLPGALLLVNGRHLGVTSVPVIGPGVIDDADVVLNHVLGLVPQVGSLVVGLGSSLGLYDGARRLLRLPVRPAAFERLLIRLERISNLQFQVFQIILAPNAMLRLFIN